MSSLKIYLSKYLRSVKIYVARVSITYEVNKSNLIIFSAWSFYYISDLNSKFISNSSSTKTCCKTSKLKHVTQRVKRHYTRNLKVWKCPSWCCWFKITKINFSKSKHFITNYFFFFPFCMSQVDIFFFHMNPNVLAFHIFS